MVTYSKNELVSATEISKQFGEYINKVKDGSLDKIGVLKNNKLNAIIVSVEEYERMSKALDMLEDAEIIKELEDRLSKSDEFIDGNEVLSKYGLNV